MATLLTRGRDIMPEWLSSRMREKRYRYSPASIPTLPAWATNGPRLVIGPANFAAQGRGLARSAAMLGVEAVNMQVADPNSFGFDADITVPINVSRFSRNWQKRFFDWVRGEATHVIIEAGRPLFGTLFEGDPIAEANALQAAGVSVATIAYGSDLRQPSRHREIDRWSPFHAQDWAEVGPLEARATRYRELIKATGGPAYVVTPELLLDWHNAVWSPLVVDIDRWQTTQPVLERDRPIVVHAPTKSAFKGTALIEPALHRLHQEGLIEYRGLGGMKAAQMPSVFASADIVLDQFALGIYATTGVEAMAAGRLTFAYLHGQVIDAIRERAGVEAPVVSVTPDKLEGTLRQVIAQRSEYQQVAARGPGFVRRLHDGANSAEVLRPFLLG